MAIQVFHNPRCSKSRQTVQLLTDNGHDAEVVEYLKTPPSKQELTQILDMLGMDPQELMRKGQKEYKELGLKDSKLSRDELIEVMVANPILIERPIVIADGQARIGRPPEQVLEIL